MLPRHETYQVLAYHGTRNLGDAIQTVAISQVLPAVVGVYRHKMHLADKTIPLVVNGWIGDLFDTCTLPTSGIVHYCGIHAAQQHFRNYRHDDVIGARDRYTVDKLRGFGLKSELVGCATLLFARSHGPRNGIYSVDFPGPGQPVSHSIPPDMPWSDQWDLALRLLEKYRTASVVYTGRLHALLPCLAFGTPVRFFAAAFGPERFSVLDFLHLDVTGIVEDFDVRPYQAAFIRFMADCLQTKLALGEPKFPAVVIGE
ncbi:MAG: polysaccharide pyruvyl transferase family protein [Thermoguttaceae bacterium]|jgi:hypothetical protein